MNVALLIFWLALGTVLYTYVLFPAIVLLRGILWRHPVRSADISPTVSLIIAAYNEAENISGRIDNIESLDYPKDLLEVIIASDGSADGTDDIVRARSSSRRLLLSLPRGGKARALNAAVRSASGEILVFSDANSMFAESALRALMRPFADSSVGAVAGNQQYLRPQKCSASSDGERTYWKFDQMLKACQSQTGNAISATGAIYAVRRSLYQDVPDGVMDDFAVSTGVIEQGYRLVYAPDAVASEPVAGAGAVEFRRKVRNIVLGLRGVLHRRRLLNPFVYGFYSIQLLSHKVLRRLVVFALLALLPTSLLLWNYGLLYQMSFCAQVLLYVCGASGAVLSGTAAGKKKFLSLPYFFCLVNLAALCAVVRVIFGQQITQWETARQGTSTKASGMPLATAEDT